MKSDSELIRELPNQDAFEELVERYSRKAYCLAFRLLGNQEDAEEALQDVFTQVFRKAKNFEGKSQFSSWLYRVTVNACLMKIRKRREENWLDEESHPVTSGGYEATLVVQLRSALSDAIRKLPDDYRPVFVMRDIDGMSSSEVGSMLGISIPAVKSRLHRSRAILRESLLPIYRDIVEDLRPTGTD
jgi:RNA polymerase sigma-70 factor (ECF subfamily)